MRSLRTSVLAKSVLAFLAIAMVAVVAAPVASAATARHTEGSVVVDGSTVWYIGASERRGFATAAEFLSHGYSFAGLQTATDGDRALPVGATMTFADGTLVNDNGTVYIVNQGTRRGFTSAAVFLGLGYSFANVVSGSTAAFTTGAVVGSTTEAHPAGTLVLDGSTVYWIRANGKAGVPSMEVFNSYGWMFSKVVAANAADRALATLANVTARMNGGSIVGDTTTGGETSTPGAEGTIVTALLATPANVEVQKGENNEEVMGFSVEAKDSAMNISRVDVVLEAEDALDHRPWKYFDEVSLYAGSTLLKSMSVSSIDDFTVTTDLAGVSQVGGGVKEYQLRFSGLNYTVAKNATANLTVKVDTLDAIDVDVTQVWHVTVPANGVRATDGTGTSQLNASAAAHRTFSVVDVTAGTLEVSANTSTPAERTVMVHDTNNTTGVEVFKFDVKAEEQNVEVDSITVNFDTSTGEETDDVFYAAHLYNGSTLLDSMNVPAGDTDTDVSLVFNGTSSTGLDLMVNKDQTVTLTVKVDVNDIDATDFPEGSTITAQIEASAITGEDANETAVTATGTAVGKAQHFWSKYADLSIVSISGITKTTDEPDEGSATMVFDVTARGGDIYIAKDGDTTGATDELVVGGLGVIADGEVTASYTSTADSATTNYIVRNGETKRFTVNVYMNNADATAGFGGFELESLPFATTDADDIDQANVVINYGLDAFESTQAYFAATDAD